MERSLLLQEIADVHETLADGPHILRITQVEVPSARCEVRRLVRVQIIELVEFVRGGEDGCTLRVDRRKQVRGVEEYCDSKHG